MTRRKVLFITSWYPTRQKPGFGVFVREHAKAVQLYDDVVVLHCAEPTSELASSWQWQQEADEQLTQGITTYRSCYRSSPVPKTSYLRYLHGAFRAYQRIVATGFQPDVLHAHIYSAGVPAVLLGKRYGLPTVISEHFSAFPRRTLPRLEILKARFAFQAVDWVLPVSATLQKGIENCGIRARFRIIPNAVDLSLFFLPHAPKSRSRSNQLLFVGALIPLKGLDCLLRALVQLQQVRSDWHLSVVGDGPQRSEYEQLALQLGLAESVTFWGSEPKAGVAEFMRKADLFVLPSLFETFSVVSIEALASGLPVLASRCGGPEEFVTEEVGRLVPPGDSRSLYLALDDMLDNLTAFEPAQLAQYAAQRFSHERVGAELDSIYAELQGVTTCKNRIVRTLTGRSGFPKSSTSPSSDIPD